MRVKFTAVFLYTALMMTSLSALASDEDKESMAMGDISSGKDKATACAACHGADGNSNNPQWPKLAGQNESYLVTQLQQFKTKERVNPIMNAQAAGLSEQDMQDLAAYYANHQTSPAAASEDSVSAGMNIYMGGNLETGVTACVACHGPSGQGNAPGGFPKLAGQHAEYTAIQLRAYKTGERVNENLKMMNEIADKLSEDEIKAVSEYIAGLH